MNRTLVVVGHGMVAHRLVERLLAGDTHRRWRVVVFGEEPWPAYDRIRLSGCLEGTGAAELLLTTPALLADSRVEMWTGTRVAEVDREHRMVRTEHGERHLYDALVLATGSRAFVPPVPGGDAPGCFTYRTLDDVETIRASATPGDGAVVVGGGLLGLEAANGLRTLGLRTHVVELAPRLMPIQLDGPGGSLLADIVRGRGMDVRCGVALERVDRGADGRVVSVTLTDGTVLDASMVVFAAGVRPRDELAAGAGLPVGPRGGFLVDELCRTTDPRVWAVGECAAVAGRCHGLVAPGYRMAESVAAQLLRETPAPFRDPDLSTRLKLLGVQVASFGDAQADTEGALEYAVEEPPAGRYAKLVLSGDGRVLLGGVLVGDTEPFPRLRALVGHRLPASADALLRRG
ncbi:NAD(P)/FAD-dependent oxidoreductase [Streptomyces sp. NPDC048219]|uniref:NAD(P)/FAD-dependent oxidoreductase n=1 Tax=Streptomyces sp. NPDC048219 TaxID=3365517 RepID=UPI00371B7980